VKEEYRGEKEMVVIKEEVEQGVMMEK